MDEAGRIQAVAEELRGALGPAPGTVITLGSGLGPVVERATVAHRVPTTAVGLPASTVPGHAGEVVRARLGGAEVALLSGRIHAYEGHDLHTVVRYVRAMHAWGVKRLILTCSAGSTRADLAPGTVTLLADHLNLMGASPLVGPAIGTRFPDAALAHDPTLRAELQAAATAKGHTLPDAVYAALMGPAFETAAEVRMLATLGADLAGMSTVPELLAACALGLPTAALAVVSNYGAGVGDQGSVDHAGVTAVANRAAVVVADVLEEACAGW
jgi:inosine/guanosine/xanthosine phosphorylase family protein